MRFFLFFISITLALNVYSQKSMVMNPVIPFGNISENDISNINKFVSKKVSKTDKLINEIKVFYIYKMSFREDPYEMVGDDFFNQKQAKIDSSDFISKDIIYKLYPYRHYKNKNIQAEVIVTDNKNEYLGTFEDNYFFSAAKYKGDSGDKNKQILTFIKENPDCKLFSLLDFLNFPIFAFIENGNDKKIVWLHYTDNKLSVRDIHEYIREYTQYFK